jgi:hypothetical protein
MLLLLRLHDSVHVSAHHQLTCSQFRQAAQCVQHV